MGGHTATTTDGHRRPKPLAGTTGNTPHLMNAKGIYQVSRPDIDGKVTKDDFRLASKFYHALPAPWLEPEDVAELGLFLASGSS
jgi:hypothetical protein